MADQDIRYGLDCDHYYLEPCNIGCLIMSINDSETYYGRTRSFIWIKMFRRLRADWKLDCDLQELAAFLEKHGASGRRTLANRSRSRVSKKSQAHWRRLLRLFEAWQFGFISHSQLDPSLLLLSQEIRLDNDQIDPTIKKVHKVTELRERMPLN